MHSRLGPNDSDFDGFVDEARFWKDRVLTAAEVALLYSNGIPATYTYAGTSYANPDAPTSIGDGAATTTYYYDFRGNLASTTGATSTNYVWDYANRMTAAGVNGATSTYGYDTLGNRMFQTSAGATTTYPTRFYSTDLLQFESARH